MLKIAEYNKITGKMIELSELEQFGFKYYPSSYEKWLKVFENSISGDIRIRITNDRIIYPVIDLEFYNLGHKEEFELHDTIYDLIEAGYVEKVEE